MERAKQGGWRKRRSVRPLARARKDNNVSVASPDRPRARATAQPPAEILMFGHDCLRTVAACHGHGCVRTVPGRHVPAAHGIRLLRRPSCPVCGTVGHTRFRSRDPRCPALGRWARRPLATVDQQPCTWTGGG